MKSKQYHYYSPLKVQISAVLLLKFEFHFLSSLWAHSAYLHCALNFTHTHTHTLPPVCLQLLNTCVASLQRFNYFYMQFLSKWNGNHLKAVRPLPFPVPVAILAGRSLATCNWQLATERVKATGTGNLQLAPFGAAGHESAHKCG